VRVWTPILLALHVVVGGGCAARNAAREASGAEVRVRHVEIDGNHHLSDEEIRRYLNLRETRSLPAAPSPAAGQ
jgi:cell division septal protein FtsQ